ncbi:hypothetical protein DM860_008108 [Cuscuta australis]|uniref:Uncharacterized protein n=1 Tax=Cuscuta australis TaxID=267555 RepID=A0A328D691_9ASTE|nr:hypothetical protein DM860_008108 [Cuscuta australis]
MMMTGDYSNSLNVLSAYIFYIFPWGLRRRHSLLPFPSSSLSSSWHTRPAPPLPPAVSSIFTAGLQTTSITSSPVPSAPTSSDYQQRSRIKLLGDYRHSRELVTGLLRDPIYPNPRERPGEPLSRLDRGRNAAVMSLQLPVAFGD